jgi:hypothetical protein
VLKAASNGWPAPLEYCVALQNPRTAFLDPALAGGTVELNTMQLPKPRGGQMATVFKVQTGEHTWAVRCFGSASAERAERYDAITAFLAGHRSRYTVGFEYLQDGIRVDGLCYPILRMQWVEGDLLHVYLAKHRGDANVLFALAHAWIDLSRELHVLAFAHGDLQHGNVIVTRDGDLRLIDYDGMFVPELAGRCAAENGHRNYQHPRRDARTFGPTVDTFSLWAIFISIVALARDASVWEALDYGDDCLAFRHADFVRPSTSRAFLHLRGGADGDVRALAAFLESMLSHDPQGLPPLEDRVSAVEVSAPKAGAPRQPAWLPQYQVATNAAHAGAALTVSRVETGDLSPLARGAFREPYGFAERDLRAAWREWMTNHRTAATVGAGAAATVGGFEMAHAAGFLPGEYGAAAALVWLLAAIIAGVSRSPGPRTRG